MDELERLHNIFGGKFPANVIVNMGIQVLLLLIQILWARNVLTDQDVRRLREKAQSSMEWAIKNP